jgi:hypothetical protein
VYFALFFIVDNSMNEKSLDQIGILNFGTNKKNFKMFFILYFIWQCAYLINLATPSFRFFFGEKPSLPLSIYDRLTVFLFLVYS